MARDFLSPDVLSSTPAGQRKRWSRIGIRSLFLLLALALALATPLAVIAQGQPPRSPRITPTRLPDLEPDDVEEEETVRVAEAPMKLIIDTDLGVDDAAALIGLFSYIAQTGAVDVLGVVSVTGNTDVYSATNSILLILNWLEVSDVPVVRGADQPSVQMTSKLNQLIFGPDGLWGLSLGSPQDTSSVLTDAPEFYCETLAANPGATVMAIGPLTNLANAMNHCDQNWAGVRIVTLGGGKYRANQSPVSEFNYWFDPEAADVTFSNALDYGYTLEQVPEDAFDQFVLRFNDLNSLYGSPNSAMSSLLPALTFYICALTQQCYYDSIVIDGQLVDVPRINNFGVPILFELDEFGSPTETPVPPSMRRYPAIPDPVAALYTIQPDLGTPWSALVKIVNGNVPEYVRGQSIIGLSLAERLSMIATTQQFNDLVDLAFSGDADAFLYGILALLASDPDNATVVVDVAARLMINGFLSYVTGPSVANVETAVSGDEVEDAPDIAPGEGNRLLLPVLSD